MKFRSLLGLDIDETLDWEVNDSLINIPTFKGAIIITNPPYIAKQSASRKKIDLSLSCFKFYFYLQPMLIVSDF